jgi:hypothetical protein
VNPEMEKGLLCIAALARLNEYIDEKDLAGECVCRVALMHTKQKPGNAVYTDHLHFYFEFPHEYLTMCRRVYLPQAVHFLGNLKVVTVELVEKIEASNRYKEKDSEDKCALLFAIPQDIWSPACRRVFEHGRTVVMEAGYLLPSLRTSHYQSLGELFPPDLTKLMYDFVSNISMASNQAGIISDDPTDPNYRIPMRED